MAGLIVVISSGVCRASTYLREIGVPMFKTLVSKKRMTTVLAVAAVTPVLILSTSGSAFAESQVHWRDAKTGGCLITEATVGAEHRVSTDAPGLVHCFDPIGHLKTSSHLASLG
ncbi:hypothetical protein ACFYOD_39360 [Streptomyces sp. NPDC006703]|uniref:hypothetical protein n=1 Tax=Streptomyces sp. NPDC006703 TaxID=3364759 RepID=UPI0036A40407